jgi:hypothetical protein
MRGIVPIGAFILLHGCFITPGRFDEIRADGGQLSAGGTQGGPDTATDPDCGEEVCDGLDNDCDGLVDEADPDLVIGGYVDQDGDGIGAEPAQSCEQPISSKTGDCADDDPSSFPGAPQICGDGVDNSCGDLSHCGPDSGAVAEVAAWSTEIEGEVSAGAIAWEEEAGVRIALVFEGGQEDGSIGRLLDVTGMPVGRIQRNEEFDLPFEYAEGASLTYLKQASGRQFYVLPVVGKAWVREVDPTMVYAQTFSLLSLFSDEPSVTLVTGLADTGDQARILGWGQLAGEEGELSCAVAWDEWGYANRAIAARERVYGAYSSLHSVGDLDGDGLEEAALANPEYSGGRGEVRVLPGGSLCDMVGLLDGPRMEGATYGKGFGRTLRRAGDLDGDGQADLLVGSQPELGSGEGAYLYAGTSSLAELFVSPAATLLTPTDSPYVVGFWGGGADLDGDGQDDWVAANRDGQALLFFGPVAGALSPDGADRSWVGGANLLPTTLPDLDGDGSSELLFVEDVPISPREVHLLWGQTR